MTPAAGLRIGDADREAAAASLREHFAIGRLTLEEFQRRLGAAFSAKTDRDLAAIMNDLPAPSPGGLLGTGTAGRSRGAGRTSAGQITAIVAAAPAAILACGDGDGDASDGPSCPSAS